MIKQILGRLPRNRPSKADGSDPIAGSNSAGGLEAAVTSGLGGGVPLFNVSNNARGGVVGAVLSGSRVGNSAVPLGRTSSALTAPNVTASGRFTIVKKPESTGLTTGLEPLPAFRDVPNSERQNLFIKKLNLCCVVFDFNDPTKNVKEKEVKRQTLMELVEFLTSGNGKSTEPVMEEISKMVAANLFRSLAASPRDNTLLDNLDPEEDEPTMEPAWTHLQIVYEFLLRFIVSAETDAKLAKRYIDHSFVLRLLDLFDSVDPREREYLKTILHRIYGKFMVHRPFIRKAINNIFYHFILETEKHNGIAELLEILGSIINGFAIPLKEEHKLFLVRALIPLHKPKCVPMYHQQLSYCITQFIEKDNKLADTVIRGLLKYWPITNSQKEVLFLGELEEVLEAMQSAEFQHCMVPLFRQVGRCLNSSHFQVAERALFLWNNDHVASLIAQNRGVILPLIFAALERNARGHWNQAVHGLTLNVRKIFLEMDDKLFHECQHKFEEEETKAKEVQEKREFTWQQLEYVASSNAFSGEAVLVT
eukprot:c28977_g1_i2 orf=905-2509(-)